MKNKKVIVAAIGMVIIILVACILWIFLKDNTNCLKEYPMEMVPDFTLNIGSTNRKDPISITKQDIIDKNIKVYEFREEIDNNWKIVENNYVGIKLLDIFNSYSIEYEDIEFYEIGSRSVKYKKDEINENMFVIFFRDEKTVGDRSPISMISFKNKWNDALANLNYIYIHEKPINEIPIIDKQ